MAPALPAPASLAVLIPCLTLWALLRPPFRDLAFVGLAGLIAVTALFADWRAVGGVDLEDPDWRMATRRSYATAWDTLDGEAVRAAAALETHGLADTVRGEEERLAAVRVFADLVERNEDRRQGDGGRGGLLLVDPDGEPVAWAGEGLLHELRAEEIPTAGRTFEASFGAVTLLVVHPLDAGRRPWRVVAARSHPTDRLPFIRPWPLPIPGGFEAPGRGLRWSLVRRPDQALSEVAVLAPAEGAARAEPLGTGGEATPFPGGTLEAETPLLVVERDLAAKASAPIRTGRQVAWGALGLALLLVAAMRGTGLALVAPLEERPDDAASSYRIEPLTPPLPVNADRPFRPGALPSLSATVAAVTLVAVAGALALVRGYGAQSDALLALALGLSLAVAGVGFAPRLRWSPELRGKITTVGRGAGTVLLLALLAWGLQLESAAFDPDAPRGSPVTLYTLRFALSAAAFGLLALAGGRVGPKRLADGGSPRNWSESGGPRGDRGEIWGWLALPPLLAGAAMVDVPWVALPLLAVVGAALALWLGQRRRTPAVLAVLVVLAAVLAGAVWETAHRELLRDHLAQRVLPRLDPSGPEERVQLAQGVDSFFTGTDLTRFVPRTPVGLGREDLAFLLWQSSPLVRPHALSRLVVEPLDGGTPSSFSFGLPAVEPVPVEAEPAVWPAPVQPPVQGRLVDGTATLHHGGVPWAVVRWSVLPLPGFRLHFGAELDDVEAALLRGLPGGVSESGMPGSAIFVAYDAEGRALTSPWREQPRLPDPLAAPGSVATRVSTPAGPAWAVSRPVNGEEGGWYALYLPWLTPRASLERVGTRTLEVFLVILAAALTALVVALPRVAFRAWLRRAVRSYSRRLLLIYTVLLLVPLLLLNVVLVAAVENRLRKEQRAAGEAALASAQKVVGDYLASVEPGFDLANVLDDELLLWISEVLRHEINLYWGSEVWASSKPELFTARLLPKRIPGESFAGIAFLGYDLATRTNRVGDVSYLELYAPLRVPGEKVEPANFFLSMPLLAQQEEVARELAALRRQALLVTVVLILLVSAVGVRLSRSFTRPLTELVEGTRRIAAGATSLDLSPSELELAALVEAVDEMARRIAMGRERLVREKQVVERMVEHITSGIVSLDHERRVLMRNRVAAELLGVEVGDRLDVALQRRERLASLVPWLAAADRHLAQRTVRLLRPEGGGRAGDEGRSGEGGGEREWTLVWVPVPGAGEPSALLVVEDVTETLRSQRLEAWAEMARIIAHEIKNPLTPIRLNIEHVQQVWRDRGEWGETDPRFGRVLERCADNVLQQVEELREIASEFSTYSRIPKIEPRRGNLVEAMRELVEPYRSAPPPGVEVGLEADEEEIPARFDRRLLARAVRNLVENALRASTGGGRVILRVERRSLVTLPEMPEMPEKMPETGGTSGRVSETVSEMNGTSAVSETGGTSEGGTSAVSETGGTSEGASVASAGPAVSENFSETGGTSGGGGALSTAEARISVLDSGPGIAPNLLQRIFDPYFSTFDTGTGLGLPIARRIAEEHGGSIAARNRPGGGLEVTITLPAE